jgi:apolipoprotein N-acyltransferase
VPLAVGTCFEVAFDDLPRKAVRAGGQLLVLPSNNASYGRSAQSAQQLAMARLRAVEHGRSTVVATTSGISALIRPDGEVVAQSGLYEPALLQAALPRRTDLTVATRWGGEVEVALVALLLLPVAGRWRRRSAGRAPSSGQVSALPSATPASAAVHGAASGHRPSPTTSR